MLKCLVFPSRSLNLRISKKKHKKRTTAPKFNKMLIILCRMHVEQHSHLFVVKLKGVHAMSVTRLFDLLVIIFFDCLSVKRETN